MSSKEINFTLFSYKTLVHAVAGSVGSVVALSTFYPLDTIRSRLQLEDREAKNTWVLLIEFVKNEGFGTLYRGILPVLKSLWTSNFVYFYTFHGLKLLKKDQKGQNAARDLLLASIAGVINVLITTPLWVANTRLKMKGIRNQNVKFNGLLDGIAKIKEEEGILALWSGIVPSLILVLNPALQFMVYEAVKRQLPKIYPNKNFGSLHFFFVGALAKAIATLVTYPIQLVQAKLRHGHKYPNLTPDAGIQEIVLYITKKEGVSGLYKGLEAKMLQTVLTAALMFATYEKIYKFVFRVMKVE